MSGSVHNRRRKRGGAGVITIDADTDANADARAVADADTDANVDARAVADAYASDIRHTFVARSVTIIYGSLASRRGGWRRSSTPEDRAAPPHVGR